MSGEHSYYVCSQMVSCWGGRLDRGGLPSLPPAPAVPDPAVKNISKKYEINRFFLITQKPLKIAKKLWYTKRKINKFPKFWYRSQVSSTIFNNTATETAAQLLYSKKRPTGLFHLISPKPLKIARSCL